MSLRSGLLSFCILLLTQACTSGWQAGARFVAEPRRVAEALGDPPPPAAIELAVLPDPVLPDHPRPCCAFGMDLHVDFAGMEVPVFELGNVIAIADLGGHRFSWPLGAPEAEGNGLLYTCRAGWIDTGHVRENADTQLFLTLAIARTLGEGGRIVIPGHGAETVIVVDPIPEALLAQGTPIEIASTLAAWAVYRMSIWHEVSSWYGYELIPGFSERASTFSPEDLYSNALGIRLASAIVEAGELGSDDDYDRALEAYLAEALRRLEAQPAETSRAVMEALDGVWWDSSRRLPDELLVTRRHFPEPGPVVRPWRAEQAFDAAPEVLRTACGGAQPRPLAIRARLGDQLVSELVHVTWAPESWAEASFPYPDGASHVVSEQDLDGLVERTHAEMRETFGADFDVPRGTASASASVASPVL